MNNEEMNTLMAEEVIGWKKIIRPPMYVGVGKETEIYSDGKGTGAMCKDWNPTEDIAQALMCIDRYSESFGGDEYEAWSIMKHIRDGEVRYEIVIRNRIVAEEDLRNEIPKAICEAIAEAIGGKNE